MRERIVGGHDVRRIGAGRSAFRRLGAGRCAEGCDIPGKLAAFFDGDLAVTDSPRHAAGRVYDKVLARRQFALEAAADFRDVDPYRSRKYAVLGDLDHAAVHRGFHAAFDDEGVAVGDFDALQFDVRSDDQFAALTLFAGDDRLRGLLNLGFGLRRRVGRAGATGGRRHLQTRCEIYVAVVFAHVVFLF